MCLCIGYMLADASLYTVQQDNKQHVCMYIINGGMYLVAQSLISELSVQALAEAVELTKIERSKV